MSIQNEQLSRQMILILICSAPVIILQRLNSLIYSIRVEDYKMQAIDVFANLLKIVSIGFFIHKDKYDIVGYFLTIQIIGFISGVFTAIWAFVSYRYSFKDFIESFHFNKEIFNLTKHLAISTLLSTIAWVLYFEMDSVILSKYYGLKVLALYGLGFTMVSFIRTLYSVVFSPFLSIFNHKVGVGDEEGMFITFGKLINWVMPLLVLMPLLLNLNMPGIIHAWVGDKYRLLIIMISLTGFSIPLGHIIIAKSANRILRLNAVLLPVIFYSSLIVFHFWFGIYNLAISKLLTIAVSVVLVFYLFSRNVQRLDIYFIKPLFRVLVSCILAWGSWYAFSDILPFFPSIMGQILRIIFLLGVPFMIGSFLYFFIQTDIRRQLLTRIRVIKS